MENLGITKEILIIAFIGLIVIIIFLFAFILVGVAAFSIPGTFGSVINSIFPIGIVLFHQSKRRGSLFGAGQKGG